MPMYDNAPEFAYEEIKGFYPSWYADIKEMDAIWSVQGVQLDKVRAAVELIISNNYIDTADEYMINRLVRFLGITSSTAQSLEERRQVLASLFRGSSSHIGSKEIKEIVRRFTEGATVTVGFADGIISVTVGKEHNSVCNYLSCYTVLCNSIPAHLQLDMQVIALLKRESRIFTGTAIRITTTIVLGLQELPALTDELDDPLYDDDDTFILDGLEASF